MLWFVAFLSVFSLQIQADLLKCETQTLIEPPCNISQPWFYPTGYNDSGVPPQFAENQNCTWKFTVPKGTFAFLTVTTTNSAAVTIIDSIGTLVWASSTESRDPYFLLDPGFSVTFGAQTSEKFGMRVVWMKTGSFAPTTHKMIAGDTPFVIFAGSFDNGTVISSDSRVSLVSLPPPSVYLDLMTYMRNTVVFDGPTINDKLIGNLYQIQDSGNHFVSTGKSLTLFSLIPNLNIHNYVLLQDYNNVKQFSTYKGISCILDTMCPFSVDARNGAGAAVRYSGGPQYLNQIEMLSTSSFSVYTGPINDEHLLVKYTNSPFNSSLPQEFSGLFTTYVLDKGIGVGHLSYNKANVKWTTPFDGRRGFIASKNYATSSLDQNVDETISSPSGENYKITLSVENSGLTGAATLQVTIGKGNKNVQDITYTSTQLPTSVVTGVGNSLSVKYRPNGTPTTGVYVKYAFVKSGAAISYGSLILSFAIVFWNVKMQ